jgi:hypothetical protein
MVARVFSVFEVTFQDMTWDGETHALKSVDLEATGEWYFMHEAFSMCRDLAGLDWFMRLYRLEDSERPVARFNPAMVRALPVAGLEHPLRWDRPRRARARGGGAPPPPSPPDAPEGGQGDDSFHGGVPSDFKPSPGDEDLLLMGAFDEAAGGVDEGDPDGVLEDDDEEGRDFLAELLAAEACADFRAVPETTSLWEPVVVRV